MNQPFGYRQLLIILLLLTIILIPRPLAGATKLESARRFADAGDYAAASPAYASAAMRLPWDASLCGLAGQAYWLAGEPDQAVHWFGKGEARQGLSLDDWLTYGDVFAALGDDPSAVRAWEQSILQHEPSFGASWRLALASRREGDLPSAIDHLNQALALAPEDAGTHYQLGLLMAATDPEKALPYLMQAVTLDPDMEDAVQTLRSNLNLAFLVEDRAYQFTVSGRTLASLGEWDLAAEAFRRAIEENEVYAEAWAWLGEARQQTGLDGRSQLERALAIEPQSSSIQALDGLYWMRQGEPEKALSAYENAAALEPENPAWQISLGDAASASGDLLAAMQYYYRAVELGPENPTTWRALALFSLDNDADVENSGLVASQQLLRLAPKDWLTYDIAGRTAIRFNEREEAKTYLLKAIDLSPLEPAPHFHLAQVYLESGLAAEAYDKLMDTLALDPDGTYGWQATRLLEQYFP